MRLFGAKWPPPDSESQWLIPWRDSDGRFSIDFPFRVTSTIGRACYGPTACRAGLFVGFVEQRGAHGYALQILHAIPLEIDADGQLDAAARERLTVCRPTPGKAVMTVGFFVPDAPGEPEAFCALVSSSKRLFPTLMVIAVVRVTGVAQLYEWRWGEDRLIAMSPELPLQASPFAEAPDAPTAYRPAATAMVQTGKPAPAAARSSEPEGLSASSGVIGERLQGIASATDPVLPAASGVTVRFDVPRWVGVGILLLGTGMLATGIWYVRKLDRPTQQVPQKSATTDAASDRNQMALQVSRRSSDLLITWDRSLQSAIGARHGVLQITDGDQPNYLPLTVKDLISAQVVYVPRSKNVTIQLTAFTDSTSLQETVRVIQADTPRVAETVGPIPIRPAQKIEPVSAAPDVERLRTVPTESSTVAAAPRADPAPTRTDLPSSSSNSTEASISEVVLPPPPVAKPEERKPPGTIRLEPTTPAVVQPTAQKPPETLIDTTAVKPTQSSAPQPPATELKAPRSPVSDFKPAVATRQVSPVLDNNIKRMLVRDTPVSVKLRVDANGNVISAEAEKGSGLASFLGKVAEETARNWRFQPATSAGKPIPADFSITFIFKR